MLCPNCNTNIHFQASDKPVIFPQSGIQGTAFNAVHIIAWGFCPNDKCNRLIIKLFNGSMQKTYSPNTVVEDVDKVHEEQIIYPSIIPQLTTPVPIEGMPEEIILDYEEARAIVDASHRAAAALLRLCVQKLMPLLGEKGKNINDDIASLVQKGLPIEIQQSLDILRVIGNESVHPGEINLNDDRETANSLFNILNLIVERMIVQPKKIKAMYENLPDNKKRKNLGE